MESTVKYLIGVLGKQYQFLQWLGFIFCPQNFGISSSLGRAKNYHYKQYFVPLEINKVSFHSKTIAFLLHQ